MFSTEMSFVIYFRLLNIALVAQGEPEATLPEAQSAYRGWQAETDACIALAHAA